jgi:hypothetical protein
MEEPTQTTEDPTMELKNPTRSTQDPTILCTPSGVLQFHGGIFCSLSGFFHSMVRSWNIRTHLDYVKILLAYILRPRDHTISNPLP